MRRLLIILFAFVGALPNPAFAAGDQVLRAAYCLKAVDGMIAWERQTGPAIVKQALEGLQQIARTRSLTPAEQRDYAAIQNFEPLLRQRMENTRSRLAAYVITSSRLLGGVFSDDENALSGALSDLAAINVASNRGQADFAQCQAEQSGNGLWCIRGCASECTTNSACMQQCATRCGAPARCHA
jgi:hypothetical protein